MVLAGGDDHDNGSPVALEEVFPNSTLTIVPGDHNNTYKGQGFSDAIMEFLKPNEAAIVPNKTNFTSYFLCNNG